MGKRIFFEIFLQMFGRKIMRRSSEEKVTNVTGILLIERNENIRPQRNKDFMLLFSFGLIELVQMRLCPFIGICTMTFFHDFRSVPRRSTTFEERLSSRRTELMM